MRAILLNLLSCFVAAACFAGSPSPNEARLLEDGLRPTEVRGFDSFWLRPGTDLRSFGSVRFEPVEVRFSKSWLRRYNRDQRSLAERLSEADLAPIAEDLAGEFDQAIAGELTKSSGSSDRGLQVQPELIQMVIRYPDLPSSGRKEVLVQNAGEATLILRFTDLETGQLLAWARDRRQTSDHRPFRRATRAFNRFEFNRLFATWARHLEPQLMGTP